MKFTKMHGAGNDYIYVDCTQSVIDNPSQVAIDLSDRHFGIGSDGLILIKKSDKADFFMEMYNADGSQGQMCGNGIRCVGKFVYDKGLTKKETITVETLAGIKTLVMTAKNGKIETVEELEQAFNWNNSQNNAFADMNTEAMAPWGNVLKEVLNMFPKAIEASKK